MITTLFLLTLALSYILYNTNRTKTTYRNTLLELEREKNSIQSAYEACARTAIQNRLILMNIDIPNLRSYHQVFNKVDDLKRSYENRTIDVNTYYHEVNKTLDLLSSKSYT